MKRKIYPLIVTMAILLFALSGCSKKPFSAFMGLGMCTIPSSEEDSWSGNAGGEVGANMPIADINESMNIRAELNFTKQGAKWEEPAYDLKGSVNLWYANLPFVVRYQAKSGFFGEAGIEPGFLLSAKDKYSGESHDYKDNIKKFNLGIPLGVGYEFKNNFGIGLRVIPGVTNINAEGPTKARNFLAVLRGSYTFKFK